MVSINIREFAHNLSKYLNEVKAGERLVIMERNKPIADIIPHHENIAIPGWKRPIKRITIKGEPMSKTTIRMRREERS